MVIEDRMIGRCSYRLRGGRIMHNWKYSTPLVLLVVMPLLLPACGGSGSGDNTTSGTTPSAGQPTTGATDSTATTPAAGASQPAGGDGMIAQLNGGGFGG